MAKIVFIAHTARMNAGTSHSLLALLSNFEKNYDISVIVPAEGELVRELSKIGVEVHIQPFGRRYIPLLIFRLFLEKPHVIYLNNFSDVSYCASIAARLLHIPCIWHVREILKQSDTPHKLKIHAAMRSAAAIIANSSATAHAIENCVPMAYPHVIPNGVNIQKFKKRSSQDRPILETLIDFQPGDFVIINIGSFRPLKNQLAIVDLADRLAVSNPEVKFCLVGDIHTDYGSKVIKKIKQKNLERSVYLVGHQTDVNQLLAESDLMVHVSQSESQGRVILEAMASELPVVAYDVGGIRDALTNNETGFLVPYDDENNLFDRVIELISNPTLCYEMGQAGRKLVTERFTAAQTTIQVKNVIDCVLNIKQYSSIKEKNEKWSDLR